MGGSLGEAHAETIVRAAAAGRRAGRARSSASSSPAAPGCRRAMTSLSGYGEIFRASVELQATWFPRTTW